MSRTCLISLILFLLTDSAATVSCLAESWPAFRGGPFAEQRGRAEGTGYPRQWSRDDNIVWRFPLPAAGNSSPVVADGKVLITCATEDGKFRHLYCVEVASGKELWKQTVAHEQDEPTHKTNPYCGSTPAVGHDRVLVWHGSAGLFCYSLDGKELWKKETGPIHHIWGYGSSPVIHEGVAYLNIGPGEKTYLTALAMEDGTTLWETPESGGSLGENGPNGEKAQWIGSWSTPQLANIDGRLQVVCAMPTRVAGYDPATGEVIWSCGGLENLPRGNLVYTDPLLTSDISLALGGFKGPGIAFRAGGKGDITEANRVWRVTQRTPQRIGSGIILGKHAFLPAAGPNGIECIDVATGEQLWMERTDGAAFWGSMILADGVIYITDQRGTTFVIKPNSEKLEILHENELKEASNATPAFADGAIYLRTSAALYRIGKESPE